MSSFGDIIGNLNIKHLVYLSLIHILSEMDMNLFDYMRESKMESESPLASRLRPKTLDEVVGQQHIVGRDKLLYRAIKADKLGSIIFYGPPGTGKTTLAKDVYKRQITTCAATAPWAPAGGRWTTPGIISRATASAW